MSVMETGSSGVPFTIEALREIVDDVSGRACLIIQREVLKFGSLEKSKRARKANVLERRASGIVRRLERLMILRQQQTSKIESINLPKSWTLNDLEAALVEIGATNEDRPPGILDGTGRKPPLELF